MVGGAVLAVAALVAGGSVAAGCDPVGVVLPGVLPGVVLPGVEPATVVVGAD